MIGIDLGIVSMLLSVIGLLITYFKLDME
ncbi:Protein of unknown function [Bacillus cytotoxicus]|uniref:Uncharacterized protein n=1 Tax=Bacillus cytotoxicus TaxID=580165 RepID=A0AAX2CFD1_9BACI|nr:Protein of unknown function [Bacillus cytotoxicus]SCN34631.1 Protein of unknown function [Bacillus cytotoxicus]